MALWIAALSIAAVTSLIMPVAALVLALAGRGINRRSGALIIAAYVVFAVTVIAKTVQP